MCNVCLWKFSFSLYFYFCVSDIFSIRQQFKKIRKHPYDVIYALWTEINFECETKKKTVFRSLFLADRHTLNESVKGNLLCAWNLFLSIFFCSFQHTHTKNGEKNQQLSVIFLIDTDNGKDSIKQTPDCYGFRVRFTGSAVNWLYSWCFAVCMCFSQHTPVVNWLCALNASKLMLVVVFSAMSWTTYTRFINANSISRCIFSPQKIQFQHQLNRLFFSLSRDLPFCYCVHLIVMRRLVKIYRFCEART